jgi:hypothetical protein
LLISNDTIVTAGHANGSTNSFASSYLLHRMTIEGDSLDTFEYPTEGFGYSSSFAYGVIECENNYYIYGAGRRQNDDVVVGIILRLSKSGELIKNYEYEGGLASHVFALQEHLTLGLVFIDEENNGVGAGNPPFRRIIQFLPDSTNAFNIIYSLENSSDNHLTILQVLDDGKMVFVDKISSGLTVKNGLRYVSEDGIHLYDFEYDQFLSGFPTFSMGSIAKTSTNDLLVCGSGLFDYGDLPFAFHGYLMKVNEGGEFQWQRYFVRYDGDALPVHSWLFDAIELDDSSILATGYQEVMRNGELEWDVWLLKLDENGCLIEDDCDTQQFTTSVFDELPVFNDVFVYPNPTSDYLFIESGSNQLDKLEIWNMNGEKMSNQNFINRIDLSDLSSGIYLLKVKDQSGKSHIKRFVKI